MKRTHGTYGITLLALVMSNNAFSHHVTQYQSLINLCPNNGFCDSTEEIYSNAEQYYSSFYSSTCQVDNDEITQQAGLAEPFTLFDHHRLSLSCTSGQSITASYDYMYCDEDAHWDGKHTVNPPNVNGTLRCIKGYQPKKQPLQCTGGTNPINPANGEKIQTERDFTDDTVYPITFSRLYSSHKASPILSKLGNGWRHNYDVSIEITPGTTTDRALVNLPDGREIVFVQSNTQWNSDTDVVHQLIELTNSGQRTGWEMLDHEDKTFTFDESGKLQSIRTRDGHTHTLDRTISTINGGDDNNQTLDRITSSVGNEIQLSYGSNGSLAEVLDSNGQTYKYSYNTNGQLISVTYPDNTPTVSTDNPVRQYHYGEFNSPSHALTGITDENGDRFATWKYDINGRAISSEHAGLAELVTLTYDDINHTVAITDSHTDTKTYSYALNQEVYKLESVSGYCSACGTTTQNRVYDANGFLESTTDFSGNQTTYTYNTRGLEEERTEAVGTNEQRRIVTQWHTDYRLPTQIDVYDKNNTLVKRTINTYDTQGRLAGSTTESF